LGNKPKLEFLAETAILTGGFTIDAPGAVWVEDTLYLFGRSQASQNLVVSTWSTSWSSWNDTNLQIYSGPAVIAWDKTRIDVFYMGNTSQLMHTTFWVGQPWVGITEDLGGKITSTPSVSAWSYGRFDVFAKGTNESNLWWKSYDQCNGGWSKWLKLSDI